MINSQLVSSEHTELLQQYTNLFTATEKHALDMLSKHSTITALVDGRGLACPMPLLKTKVALRSMAKGDTVYVLATDPNSQLDLAAFCKQTGLHLVLSTQTHVSVPNEPIPDTSTHQLKKLDTIFHLIITKTHGN